MRYTTTNDAYLLTQFRFTVTIQPIKWLTLFGETQDSRMSFNQHVPDAVPYQNTWDIRQAYVRIGSGQEGSADVIVGRQVLAFGDERVIGPSDWTNTARTFDAVRLDVHQTHGHRSLFLLLERLFLATLCRCFCHFPSLTQHAPLAPSGG